ncbi:MAG: hypothetical protein AVDCRST_MAG03-2091, partial [uncultured Rubrobacteraceae bacterium]
DRPPPKTGRDRLRPGGREVPRHQRPGRPAGPLRPGGGGARASSRRPGPRPRLRGRRPGDPLARRAGLRRNRRGPLGGATGPRAQARPRRDLSQGRHDGAGLRHGNLRRGRRLPLHHPRAQGRASGVVGEGPALAQARRPLPGDAHPDGLCGRGRRLGGLGRPDALEPLRRGYQRGDAARGRPRRRLRGAARRRRHGKSRGDLALDARPQGPPRM